MVHARAQATPFLHDKKHLDPKKIPMVEKKKTTRERRGKKGLAQANDGKT
jgi:hypothetical protein